MRSAPCADGNHYCRGVYYVARGDTLFEERCECRCHFPKERPWWFLPLLMAVTIVALLLIIGR